MPTVYTIFRRNSLGLVVHVRARVLGWGLLATVITSITATSAAPTRALADQVTDKKAQAALLAERINAESRQVEVLAEQYNGAQYHLDQVKQQLADAEQRLGLARIKAERNRVALAGEAVNAYIHGGTTSQTLESFSGSVDLAVQQGYFRLATGNQADALNQLRTSERALGQQQAALQGAQRESQDAIAAMFSRQQAVRTATAASQATLSQVQGDLVQLVAQKQAEIAAQQQQQAQAQASLLAARARLGGTGGTSTARAGPPGTAGAIAAPAASAMSTGNNSRNSTAPAAGPVSTSGHGPSGGTSQTTALRAPAVPASGAPSTGAPSTAPPATQAPKPKLPPPPPPVPTPVPAPSSGVGAVLAYARAQIGKPYQWGGAGPDSFDCSGLTMRAWEAAGVSLPHYARAQYANTAHVAIADLRPGDLVFFGSDLHHVGLYIGNGQMIDAPSTGQFVRTDSIFWSDLQPYGGRPG